MRPGSQFHIPCSTFRVQGMKYPAGPDDNQANSFSKVVLIAARYGGTPEVCGRALCL